MILNYRSNCLYAGAILFNAANPLAVSLLARPTPFRIDVRARSSWKIYRRHEWFRMTTISIRKLPLAFPIISLLPRRNIELFRSLVGSNNFEPRTSTNRDTKEENLFQFVVVRYKCREIQIFTNYISQYFCDIIICKLNFLNTSNRLNCGENFIIFEKRNPGVVRQELVNFTINNKRERRCLLATLRERRLTPRLS